MGEKMNNIIIPMHLHDSMDSFMRNELQIALGKAKAWRKNNKHDTVSIECNIATYRFKWTKCNNMHLTSVIKKGER